MVAIPSSMMQGSTRLQLYPNQFFSLSEYHLPRNTKALFKWCEYFFSKDPIIGAAINKLAAYPITDFIYSIKGDDVLLKAQWETLLERHLDLKSLLIRMGLNYFVYGNSFLSLRFGNTRSLMCNGCKQLTDITSNDNHDTLWRFSTASNEPQFTIKCPHCNEEHNADIVDMTDPKMSEIRFVEWDPFNIDVKYYPIIGKSRYFYKIPNKIRNAIKLGRDKYQIKTMPEEYLKAIAADKDIELNNDNLFHFKRHSLASGDQGWGKPLVLHSLQRLFYLYTLRRAQEAIAIQHLTPLDILFPMAQGSMDPFADVDLKDWVEKARAEIQHHRADPNYVGLMPVPMGTARVGGDGRALLLGPEIDAGNKEVAAGMGVPLEFIFGGLSWAGSSVSLRLLENSLINYRQDVQRMISFIIKKLKVTLNMKPCDIKMADLRMADDIQRMQIAMQLNSAQKLSDDEMLKELGWDSRLQKEKIDKEIELQDKFASKQMLNQANASGEVGIINARYQAKAEIAHQETLNQSNLELEKSMPEIQRKMKRLDEVMNYLNMMMTYLQMTGQLPPQQEGGAPPEEGGEAPPPEEGATAPAAEEEPQPEEEGGPVGVNPAMAGATAGVGSAPATPPMVEDAWWENPFYQNVQKPDVKRMLKRLANDVRAMTPAERTQYLQYLRTRQAGIYNALMAYMQNTPLGGNAGDA
jgi:hypothetical protein